MPRDLLADRKTLDSMPQLSRASPSSPPATEPSPLPSYNSAKFAEQYFKNMDRIRPFGLLLNPDDLDDCDWLEHAAFDPVEAASREKLEYRLRTCGELCSGIFTSAYPTASGPLGEVLKTRKFPSIDSHDADRKRILLGHIIATKSSSRLVTDEAMDYPKDWQIKYQLNPDSGHDELGETICIHSLCVHPDFQGKGFGQILLKSYVQRIKDSGVAKRISLICRDRLVGYYEKAGFSKIGPSKCQYGGGNWVDMVLEFESEWEDDDGGY